LSLGFVDGLEKHGRYLSFRHSSLQFFYASMTARDSMATLRRAHIAASSS
jgi:hypothetical protein